MSACRRRAPAYPRSCLLSITRGEGRGSPADRHPTDEVVRTLMRLAVTGRVAKAGGKYTLAGTDESSGT
jgi:hypothetical protein